MCIVCYLNDHIIFNSLFVPEVEKNKMVDFSEGVVEGCKGECNDELRDENG